ncbi:MAG TPA: GTPase ObgE [Dehalococcoidia bacterium]|jgi:GTP-binding protein|nr:GTPase ObgE [Dehalococcoidia bacterium]
MIDLVEIHIISGHGGNGAAGFRREKFVPRGGPDGGDGGRGGDVIFEADVGLTTLAHFRHRRLYKAEAGKSGASGKRHGASGENLVLKVPVGTVVEAGDQSWDLDEPGARVVVARGGDGGRGNARFANSVRQAPTFAERGLPGEDRFLRLELKLLADVGLVGLPNAGKSTLLRAVSNAVPDVGDFPFTTLEPVLGVVEVGLNAFVMADLPGLIEGAHEGVGLGHQFLRHVERTRVLVHVLDAGSDDPMADYRTVHRELELYDTTLADRPEVIALNKIDLPEARKKADALRTAFPGREVVLLSGASSEGTRELLQLLLRLLQETAPRATAVEKPLPVLQPRGRDRLEVEQTNGVFVVSGEKAEQDALKLGEGGYEALDELQDRLRRQGLERVLRRAGARPGDRVRVGEVELEWQG